MPVVPMYAKWLAELGCCNGGTSDPNTSQQLAELQQKIAEQAEQIQALQQALENKINKQSLVTVYSLEDEALFQAMPISTGE